MPTPEEVRLRFNILGPIEGWSNGTRLRLGGIIQKRVLATLLLEPGKVLPISRLIEAAWEEEPPPTAPHQVRKAVADLRRRIPGVPASCSPMGPDIASPMNDAKSTCPNLAY